MEGGKKSPPSPPNPEKKPKFSVYRNPALSATLDANTLRLSFSAFLFFLSVLAVSLSTFLAFFWEERFIDNLAYLNVPKPMAGFLVMILLMTMGLVLLATLSALVQALLLHRARKVAGVTKPISSNNKEQHLTARQLELLGLQPKSTKQVDSQPSKKPPKSTSQMPSSPSDLLAPLHYSSTNSHCSPPIRSEKRSAVLWNKRETLGFTCIPCLSFITFPCLAFSCSPIIRSTSFLSMVKTETYNS